MMPDAARLKRLMFQSGHRGTKELDFMLGNFAAQCLAQMDASELEVYEVLLNTADPLAYDWLVGQAEAPEGALRDLVKKIQDFGKMHTR